MYAAELPECEDDQEELRQAVISLLLLLKEKGETERFSPMCFQAEPARPHGRTRTGDRIVLSASEGPPPAPFPAASSRERAPCSVTPLFSYSKA